MNIHLLNEFFINVFHNSAETSTSDRHFVDHSSVSSNGEKWACSIPLKMVHMDVSSSPQYGISHRTNFHPRDGRNCFRAIVDDNDNDNG